MPKVVTAKGVLWALVDVDQDDEEIFKFRDEDISIFANRKDAWAFMEHCHEHSIAKTLGMTVKPQTLRRIECRVTW